MAILLLVISMTTTFPGCLSYHIEGCLEFLTNNISNTDGFSRTETARIFRLLLKYQELFVVTRELNKRVGLGMILFYSIYAVQQTAETYCLFKTLEAGVSLADLQFLFTDIFVSYCSYIS